LRIRHAFGRTKDSQELFALAPHAAKNAHLLKYHGPRNDGEEEKKQKNSAGHPARLFKNV
jgi:hypothetical protein